MRTEFQSKNWQGGVHLGADGVDGMVERSGFRSDGAWEGGIEHVSSHTRRNDCSPAALLSGGLEWDLNGRSMLAARTSTDDTP